MRQFLVQSNDASDACQAIIVAVRIRRFGALKHEVELADGAAAPVARVMRLVVHERRRTHVADAASEQLELGPNIAMPCVKFSRS